MHRYIAETEYAVTNLLLLSTAEEEKLLDLANNLNKVEVMFKVHKWDFESSDLNEDFSEAYVMAAYGRMAHAAQEKEVLRNNLTILQASIGTHQHAIQAIAGSILQIAKQGISLVHGGLDAAPPGRMIGTASVRNIIWQARNQALHYEEGNFNKAVNDLFSTLEKEQGGQFSLAKHPNQNLAKQVLALLGWTNYENYLLDMQAILP